MKLIITEICLQLEKIRTLIPQSSQKVHDSALGKPPQRQELRKDQVGRFQKLHFDEAGATVQRTDRTQMRREGFEGV